MAAPSFTALLFRRGGGSFLLRFCAISYTLLCRIQTGRLGLFGRGLVASPSFIALLFRSGGGSFLLLFCAIPLALFYGFQIGC